MATSNSCISILVLGPKKMCKNKLFFKFNQQYYLYYFLLVNFSLLFLVEYSHAVRFSGSLRHLNGKIDRTKLRREIYGDPPGALAAPKFKLSGYQNLLWGATGSMSGSSSGSSSVIPSNKRSLLSYASSRTLDICNTAECADASQFLQRTLNFNVNPCEDFFEFTCGRWIRENPIPLTAAAWSINGLIEQHVDRINREILTSPMKPTDPTPLRQAKELYYLCTDTFSIEKQGLLPILKILDKYGGWPVVSPVWSAVNFKLMETVGDINHIYSSFLHDGILMNVGVEEDIKDTTKRIVYFDQTSSSLGRTILLNPEKYKSRLAAYKTYFVQVALALAAFTGTSVTEVELSAQADDVILLETRLAQASSADENRTSYERLHNKKQLNTWQSELDTFSMTHAHARLNLKVLLETMFSTSGVSISPEETIQVYEPDYYASLIGILDMTPLRTVANLVLWKLVEGLAPETTEHMRLIKFEYNRALYGLQKQGMREWMCPDKVVSQGFGMALASKFIHMENFKETELDEVNDLVENVRTAFVQLTTMDNSASGNWLDNSTKAGTVEKIKGISKFLGYPKWIFNTTRMEQEYAGLKLVRGNYLQSAIAMSKWFLDEHFKSLRLPNDKNTWHVHPGVVNAFYYPQSNSIHIPAAYISPPRFVMNGPESLNYGGLGSILGHELTHSLDIEGSQFDKEGNFKNWSGPLKSPHFPTKVECLADHYSDFRTPAGRINGRLTLSENIADNGGLRQAFHAYKTLLEGNDGSLKGQRLPGLEGFTPEQLFFIGYGINWCSSMRREELENQLLEFHSPPKYRVWGSIQNSVDFSNTWKCSRGSSMNPFRKKCSMW